MNGLMLVIASGLIPAVPLTVAHGNTLAAVLGALLVLGILASSGYPLWDQLGHEVTDEGSLKSQ